MHPTAERLYEAAKNLKGIEGQSALARFLNETPQVVKNWEARGVSKQGMLKAQEKIGCSAVWIKDGDDYIEGQVIRPALPASNVEPGPTLGAFSNIPVVGSAQLGDNGCWAELEYPVGHGDGYIQYPTRDKNAYALRCVGDSMKPRIRDGEFVIVEPNSEPIPGDEILLKTLDGRVMVKTLLYRREGKVHVMSVNEAHPPQAFGLAEIEKIHAVAAIVKKALWVKGND